MSTRSQNLLSPLSFFVCIPEPLHLSRAPVTTSILPGGKLEERILAAWPQDEIGRLGREYAVLLLRLWPRRARPFHPQLRPFHWAIKSQNAPLETLPWFLQP